MKKRLPNWLTYSRILVIPLLVVVFYLPWRWSDWLAAALFTYATLTDFLDGYLARIWQAHSNLGRFLDPVADKLLVTTALVLLVDAGKADALPAIAILCREVLVSGLREFLAGSNVPMPVSQAAKIKTGVQMIAIILLLVAPGGAHSLAGVMGSGLLWCAAVLTLASGYVYLRQGLKHI